MWGREGVKWARDLVSVRKVGLCGLPYVENTLCATNKYSCGRRVHTLYICYFIEHNGDDEPHDRVLVWRADVGGETRVRWEGNINPLNAELNPICHLLALLGAHHILHVSRERVKMDLQEVGCGSMDWIELAQDRDR